MSASPEFIEYVKELFEPLGKLKEGMFFGGFAFKSGNKQFAMIMGNTLYFCVNDITRKKYDKKRITRNVQNKAESYSAYIC